MAKTICDWSRKDLEKKSAKLWALTHDPCYFCAKCGRVANTKKALCKAKGFEKISRKDVQATTLSSY